MVGLFDIGILVVQLSLACLLLCSSASTAQHTLGAGSSLSVEDQPRPFLVSPDGTFSCGFLQAGDNAFTFSIWFTADRSSTAVWSANRDAPVNGRGSSRVTFRRDGELALADANGTTVWSTKTGGSKKSLAVSLRDTGNLVITDTSTGRATWQSFDWPTDTLLPSQPFTKNTKLVAGYYSLYFDNDNVLRMLYDGPEIASIYWPYPGVSVFNNGRTNYNSSRIAILDDTGVFQSSDQAKGEASDLGLGIKRRLTMEQDGNVRMYSLNASTGGWAVTWLALKVPCQAHGLCGRNGLCEYQPSLRCSCPPGYVINDSRDWRKGCKPTFAVGNCSRGAPPPERYKFIKVPHTDFYGFDLWYNESVTFKQCRDMCRNMCQCTAFSYRINGGGKCYPKGTLFNGFTAANFDGIIYFKVPQDFNASALQVSSQSAGGLMCSPNVTVVNVSADVYGMAPRSSGKWTYLFAFAGVLGLLDLLFIATGWWFLSSKQSIPSSLEAGYRMLMTSQFRRFTYRELRDATGNFKEELGRGGSGVVYRGVLDGGKVVAVKRLEAIDVTTRGDEEFWAEMTVLGRINHINLVRIWGFCSERKHKLLVYEYVDNQSLDRHLFEEAGGGKTTTTTLAWSDRYKIALGTARGLAYLHHECLEWVIHCDVKPENILLTREFDAKIADFGLAKLSKRDGAAGVELTHMRGTSGYMAPEWALNLPINAKVDVYSFGIVLLEIVVGGRIADQRTEAGERLQLPQITQVLRHVVDSGDVMSLVDARLQGQFNPRQAMEMVRISLACMEDRSSRPTMDDIAKSLTAFDDEDEHPAYHS
uniref:Receptor-like serine/threonine-protein kinase n=1 Tax=Leersia perrieri TaxID=77586 RepID=A0A0D9V3Y6_9ORYZ